MASDQGRNGTAKTQIEDSEPKTFQRVKWTAIFVACVLVVTIVAHSIPSFPAPLVELFLALLAALTVHLFDRLYFYKDAQRDANRLKGDIASAVQIRMTELTASSATKADESLARMETNMEKSLERLKTDLASNVVNHVDTLARNSSDLTKEALERIETNTTQAFNRVKEDVGETVTERMDQLADRSANLTRKALERIEHGIEETISRQMRSLDAMARSGITRIYANRDEAAGDLYNDLTSQETTRIRIIGISLNDFALARQAKLGEAWDVIKAYVQLGRASLAQKKPLHIKILLIDPNCAGAQLRSLAEARGPHRLPGHLAEDVRSITEMLLEMVNTSESKNEQTGVTFECRLYRLPPILFLCSVDNVCYVQQYHFWSERVMHTPTPVLKYRNHAVENDATQHPYPMHAEMDAHFDWIWEKASIDVREYGEQFAVGIDGGMFQSGAVNVFTDPSQAKSRMHYLLKQATEEVAIQGISLQSFCRHDILLEALRDLVEEGKVRIRILFIDPACEQAKFRSYRETRFGRERLSWLDYAKSPSLHANSDLARDTNSAIQKLLRMVEEIATGAASTWQLNLEARKYESAPHCFLLRVDDTILVEQYHYGKIIPEERRRAPAILGKDMPVIEYQDVASPLYRDLPLRRPFRLLKDHFEFAWELAETGSILLTQSHGDAAAAKA